MSRPLRIEYKGAWYHITSRGNERREIFRGDQDREKFIKILRETAEDNKVEVACYVLMSNHFHFLLHTPEGNLTRFMQRFNTAYTMYYNRRYKRSGHLLQGRYKGLLVEADEYLLEVSRYIHLNPVKIKKYGYLSLEEKKKLLDKYQWSSYRGYVGREKEDFINHSMVMGHLAGSSREGRKKYERFVLEGIGYDLSDIYEGVKGQVVLGGEGFLKWVQEQFLDGKEIKEKDVSHLRELKKQLTTGEIVKAVAAEYGIEASEILKKRSRANEARQVAIEISYQQNCGRMSLREIGQELGGMGGDAVLQAHKRFRERAGKDQSLQKGLEKVMKKLSQ